MAKNTSSASSAISVTHSGLAWTINGGNGIDNIDATALWNSNGANGGTSFTIIGGNGADTILGSYHDEIIWADSKANTDTSSNGADQIHGGGGRDEIHGGNGGDTIWGDAGGDTLYGDRGGDTFKYEQVSDSNSNGDGSWNSLTGDWIKDFNKSEGDKLDLSGLNDEVAGNGGVQLQSGHVNYGAWSDGSYVYADVTGDGVADVTIKVSGVCDPNIIGLNHGPVAQADTNSVYEDSSVSGSVAGNDSDPDGNSLTFSMTNGPIAGLTFGSDGSYTLDTTDDAYQHLADGVTQDVVVNYQVDDGHGGTANSTLTITVTGVNDAPEAVDSTGSGTEDDSSITGTVTPATDVDDGAALNYSVAPGDEVGGFTMNGDGSWSFDPSGYNYLAAGEHADVDVTYTVTDNLGATDTATLTITVNGVNDAPGLTDDPATLGNGTEDTAYTVYASDLLQGWTDPDTSDTLGVTDLACDHGSITDNGDGSYTVTLDDNYNGAITFSYNVTDGTDSVPATLGATIDAVDDAGSISGDTTGSVTEDDATNTASGALSVSDVDGPAGFVTQTDTAGTYGTFSVDADGNWTYSLNNGDPDTNGLNDSDHPTETFTVTANDGATQDVVITINGHTDGGGGGGGGGGGPTYTSPTVYTGTGDPNDYDSLTGGAADNTTPIQGSSSNDTITGGGADQNIDGKNGNDTIYGGAGDDTISGSNGNDSLYGQVGGDTINGNNDNDTIYGGSGNDHIDAGNGIDTIYGGSNNDTITGNGDADTIIGGYGADLLTGAGGADKFVYLDQKDTGDTITDFSHADGDKIDLSALGVTTFVGSLGSDPDAPASLAAHSVGYEVNGVGITLYVDTDGVAGADLEIDLSNGYTPVSGDLILHP